MNRYEDKDYRDLESTSKIRGVTPRPERVYSTYNYRGVEEH